MSKLWVAPTGRLTQGHVMDVSRGAFERALRDYDALLYTKWNPKKLKGWGCWEIRRRPEKKTALYSCAWQGNTYTLTGYKEVDIVNHVLDCAFLNYDQIRKIKEMDTWKDGVPQNYGEVVEKREQEYAEKQRAKAQESSRYLAKQFRTEIRDLKDMVLSGFNPAHLSEHWGKTGQK